MSTISGLPAHVLLVHAVVALVPLTSVLLLLIAWWPAALQRLNVLAAVISALMLVSVPLTTDAGEWLEHHLPRTPLIHTHTELGDTMLPWAIALFLVTVAIAAREFVRARRVPAGSGTGDVHGLGGRPATAVLAVLALVVALGSTVTVYRIGESGARAAWTGNFSPTELPRPPRRPAPDG
jgi:hypothetical protein